jgi:hypothetical protein
MCDEHPAHNHTSQRHVQLGTGVLATGAAVGMAAAAQAAAANSQTPASLPSASATGQVPMDLSKANTAVVFIDPQNDVLSEKGVNWGAVNASVKENGTVEHMIQIFEAAKTNGFHVFISPH